VRQLSLCLVQAGDGAELSEYEHVNKKSRSEVSQEDETHGKEPPQVEIIGTAQLKAQEVLKRREALLEGLSTYPRYANAFVGILRSSAFAFV
jgi:hypothetical protein